ncbi:MAG: hypothetical protein AAF494_00830 [Pseudomonadota bacterium]
MRSPVLPGDYLQKRRTMAGYTLDSLARDLLIVSGFGYRPGLDDFQRLKLRLAAAEQSNLHLDDEKLALIGNFVSLDADVYRRLVLLEERGITVPVVNLCRVCGCSFHDPCVHPPRQSAAPLGRSTCQMVEPTLCSNCAPHVETRGTPRDPEVPAAVPEPVGEAGNMHPVLRIIAEEVQRDG